MNTKPKITANISFDGGSIQIVDLGNPQNLQFNIRSDTNSHFAQWFYFQLNNVVNQSLEVTISGLKASAYPDGWENYRICVSYDNQEWFRLDTSFDGDNLKWSIVPQANTIYFAYFTPYSYARHLALIGYANQAKYVQHEVIGNTQYGRSIDLLRISTNLTNPKIWVIARQHPGETMAEWFMEGLIHRLLDKNDALCQELLNKYSFYLVPNMNPDGGYLGNLRTNGYGVNLNREWLSPSLEKSPEVWYIRHTMCEIGCDMFFDIHGDEAIPYVFTAGCSENLSFSSKQRDLERAFSELMVKVNPEYQTCYGYEEGHFTSETPTLATNWVGDKFDCLALTLEMPFKDNANFPDQEYGWSAKRSYSLGQSLLTTIYLLCSSV